MGLLLFSGLSPNKVFLDDMTYMAVEQDALVRSNPFRLLEVFNRHFKLQREKGGACRTRKPGRKVREGGSENR